MKKLFFGKLKAIFIVILMCLTNLFAVTAQTICSNQIGSQGGYTYELWRDSGGGCVTLGPGGTFSMSWGDNNNILARKGLRPGSMNQVVTYGADYQANGTSFLCIYGWTTNPLIEYYIVDSWGSSRPPGRGSHLGTVYSDGATYDIYRTQQVNRPSIVGTATFYQYWSVRESKRASGTITCANHFTAWKSKGLNMGNLYEVSFCVEGYKSTGSANVHTMTMTLGDPSATPAPTPQPTPTPGPLPPGTHTLQAEDAYLYDAGVETTNAGYTGSSYVNTNNAVGSYLEWSINSSLSGNVPAVFTFANGGTAARPMSITVNGAVSGTTLNFPVTANWTTWAALSHTVSLNSGLNKLRLTSLSAEGGPNLDKLEITLGNGSVSRVGDVNNDGSVTIIDALMIAQYYVGLSPAGFNSKQADVDCNSTINIVDALQVAQYYVGLLDSLPATATCRCPMSESTECQE